MISKISRPRCEKCGLLMRKNGSRKYGKKTVVRFKCFNCGSSKEIKQIEDNPISSA